MYTNVFFFSSRNLRNESFLFCPITLTCVNDQKWNPTRRALKPRRSVNRLAPSAARKQQRERQAPYTRIRAAGWTDRNNPVSIVYTNSQFWIVASVSWSTKYKCGFEDWYLAWCLWTGPHKKEKVLREKDQICTCIILFRINFFAITTNLPCATLNKGRRQTTTNFSFSLWTWLQSLRIPLQENSPTFFHQFERVGIKIIAVKLKNNNNKNTF